MQKGRWNKKKRKYGTEKIVEIDAPALRIMGAKDRLTVRCALPMATSGEPSIGFPPEQLVEQEPISRSFYYFATFLPKNDLFTEFSAFRNVKPKEVVRNIAIFFY